MAKRVFRSVKKVSGGGKKNFRAWKDWAEDDYVIGKYVDHYTDQYQKESRVIQVEDAGFKKSKEAQAIIGKPLVLNGNGMLDKAFEEIETGTYVQVTYKGMGEMEKGKYKGKEAHVVEVEIVEPDEDDSDDESEDDEDGIL